MNRLPSASALFGAVVLLAAAWWLTFESGMRLLSFAGWGIGLLLGAGFLAMISRSSSSAASSASGIDIPTEHRAAAEHLIEMICRARDLAPEEAAALVSAAWRGEASALAARRIILAPGISGARALAVLERRFAREARFAASEPWEPGEHFTPSSPRSTGATPGTSSGIPRGLEILFADARRENAPAGSQAPATPATWDEGYDPLDGDPPPGSVPLPPIAVTADEPLGHLGDFADDLDEAPPISAVSARTDALRPAAMVDFDPYAEEEWDEPSRGADRPARLPSLPAEDDDDPFRGLFPEGDELEEGGAAISPDDGEIDSWLAEPEGPVRRPNPFSPDTPIDESRKRRRAFGARLNDDERR